MSGRPPYAFRKRVYPPRGSYGAEKKTFKLRRTPTSARKLFADSIPPKPPALRRGKAYSKRNSNGVFGFPARHYTRALATYCDLSVNKPSHTHSLNANSLSYPYGLLSANKPAVHSELFAVYSRYRIYSGVLHINYIPTVEAPVNVFILVSTKADPPASGRLFLDAGGRMSCIASKGSRVLNLKVPFSVKAQYGLAKLTDEDHGSLFNDSPTKRVYIHVRYECTQHVRGVLYYRLYQKVLCTGKLISHDSDPDTEEVDSE